MRAINKVFELRDTSIDQVIGYFTSWDYAQIMAKRLMLSEYSAMPVFIAIEEPNKILLETEPETIV